MQSILEYFLLRINLLPPSPFYLFVPSPFASEFWYFLPFFFILFFFSCSFSISICLSISSFHCLLISDVVICPSCTFASNAPTQCWPSCNFLTNCLQIVSEIVTKGTMFVTSCHKLPQNCGWKFSQKAPNCVRKLSQRTPCLLQIASKFVREFAQRAPCLSQHRKPLGAQVVTKPFFFAKKIHHKAWFQILKGDVDSTTCNIYFCRKCDTMSHVIYLIYLHIYTE